MLVSLSSPFNQTAFAAFPQLLSGLQKSILLPVTSPRIPSPFLQHSQLNADNELRRKIVVPDSRVLCQVSKSVHGCLRILPVPTQQTVVRFFPRLGSTEVVTCTHCCGVLIRAGRKQFATAKLKLFKRNRSLFGKKEPPASCSVLGRSNPSLPLVLILLFGMQQ